MLPLTAALRHLIINLICLFQNTRGKILVARFQTLDKAELIAAFLVLHQQIELELSVTETVFQTGGFESGIGIVEQDMRLRGMQTERRPLGLIFDVYLLQVLIHHFREFIGLFLPDGLVLELVVEMVERLLHIGKADKEFGLDSRFFLRLVDRLDKLWLVEFLACHRHNTIHFRYHVYGRCLVELTAHFDEVVHVVAEQPRVGCHVCAIAFALLQFVYLQEMFIGTIQFLLSDKLIVVELREQHRFVGVVEREAETALGGDIAQLLIIGLVPIEGVHILIHVYLRIAALPCR